jgi:flagellar assembly protein FliH
MPEDVDNQADWERWEPTRFDAPPARPAQPSAAPVQAGPQVVLPTAAELEQMHQQAHDEGYRIGYAEGREQARVEAERLAGAVKLLDAGLAELDQRVGESLLALAIEVARRVVDESLTVRPELVLGAIRHAMAELPMHHAIVRINPEDAELVRAHLGEPFAHAGHRVLEDPAVARGGCVLEGGGSEVDATLRTRWRRALESAGAPAEWIEPEAP